jgi:hypothetical protein
VVAGISVEVKLPLAPVDHYGVAVMQALTMRALICLVPWDW